MTANDNPAEIFDRNRRRLIRDRAYSRAKGEDFIHKMMADDIEDRLKMISRSFDRCLLIGLGSAYLRAKLNQLGMTCWVADSSFLLPLKTGGIQCDEDRLPFANGSFDLVISTGALDTVNDLPGALALIRKILKADGLFLGAFLGAESLSTLKSALLIAEGDSIRSHIHPQIDIRTMGDLLQRAGFALPVLDNDPINLKYLSLPDLIRDIRDFGGSNLLKNDIRPIGRSTLRNTVQIFSEKVDQKGKINEVIEILHISGWAPHPDQPKSAPRGSGQVSLSSALKDRS